MAICRILALTAVILLSLTHCAQSQGLRRVERFAITSFDSVYTFRDRFVVPGSIQIFIDDTIRLAEPSDYTFDPDRNQLLFTLSFRVRAFADTLPSRLLRIEYRYRAIPIQDSYALHTVEPRADSTGGDIVFRTAGESPTRERWTLGSAFQKSGSIIRGVTVGSNRDLSLQSGLRLQFSGKVSDDVEVLAALTDEQSPIQPEGTTQTLREIDNIFFEVRSPWVGGTLGKFVAKNDEGRFTSFDRKLQGVSLLARPGPSGGTTRALYAVSPGRFKTESFIGREGDQGPYRLTGLANERDIVVIAGSERVYVDGVLMTRGDNQDYVIDYAAALITFAARRPIASVNRITVDFEYSDQKYSRSFVALSHSLPLADSAVTLSASYVREGDDPDATIDITLSEADRSLLASVAGDRSKAFRSGARLVGRSDSALGSYRRIDTVLNGVVDSIFVYDPASPLAVFDVSFAIPPNGVGDYRAVAFGQYEFVGKGLGAYLPLVYLPLPQLRQVAAFAAALQGRRGVVRGDVAFSSSSLNRLSTDAAASLNGVAVSVEASGVVDSSSSIGETRLTARLRYLSSEFRAIDRVAEVEFDNQWNAGGRPGETGRSDLITEGALDWRPVRRFSVGLSAGLLNREREFKSLRGRTSLVLEPGGGMPGGDYAVEAIQADSSAGFRTDQWLRQNAGISWPLSGVTPGFRVTWERRIGREAVDDTIAPTSFRYLEFGPDLSLNVGPIRSTLSYRHRLEDSIRGAGVARSFVRDGGAETFRFHGELVGEESLSSQLDLTLRFRAFDSVAGVNPAARLDNSTLIVRSRTRWSGLERGLDLNAEYEGQSERAARLQRLFIRVPFGQGDFIWVDLDSNGVQSVEEFRLTNAGDGEYAAVTLPTEELFPVTDVRASLRVRAQPGRFLRRESTLGRLLQPVTTETTLRIDEKNQEEDDVALYLLNLSRFQNDSTTISGSSIVQQDVMLFESNPEFSTRLRFLDRRGLVRLVSSVEKTQGLERSVRLRWRPTYDIGLQFDVGFNKGSLFSTDSLSRRTYDLSTVTGTGDLGYRPDDSWEIGWMLTVASTNDVVRNPARSTSRNTNSMRAVYSIENSGRLRVDIERTNVAGVNVGEDAYSLPYQLTDGYSIGTTWVARASFEYRFGNNTQASISYTGRVQPQDGRLFNIGTAEIRAYF